MEILDGLHAFIWNDPSANNCNSFLISGEKNILIDPGHHQLFGHISEGLSRLGMSPQDIDLVIITHGHPDHMEAVKIFADTSTSIAVPAIEMDFIRKLPPQLSGALGVEDFEPDILLQEGDLMAGHISLKVFHTPGHSPGSVCLYWPETKVLFTGDVVFNQGVGRTDLPGGNGEKLKESIHKISRFETDYLLTGHGDIVSGRDHVKANFEEIKNVWFEYI
ncbi:MAG: MBL fold metallo-hydrolase [Deltaproteobacteria bacterium]|nr:MBL fold metallo-hydrolase [Deltaproteobacteria bacterium]